MTYAAMLLADWLLRDDLTTVTVTDNTKTPVSAISGVHAWTGPLSMHQLAFAEPLGVESSDSNWILSMNDLAGTTPEQGWTITDLSGKVFVIVAVTVESFDGVSTFANCVARIQR